jgi:hypothetical protein
MPGINGQQSACSNATALHIKLNTDHSDQAYDEMIGNALPCSTVERLEETLCLARYSKPVTAQENRDEVA